MIVANVSPVNMLALVVALVNDTVKLSASPDPREPLFPRGIVRLIRYFGLPSASVPLAVTEATTLVPASPVAIVPVSNTGVLPVLPMSPLSP